VRSPRRALCLGAVCLAFAAARCSDSRRSPVGPDPASPLPPTASLIAVGDIGLCGSAAVAATARLAQQFPGELLLAGDIAYYSGSMRDFMECFDPAWGVFRNRWRPSPGNHEYETPGAAGYFQYFGAAAGAGYYSFRPAADWIVLMLDSNVDMKPGSPQYEFVQSTLAGQPALCAAAVWHHPLFSSGQNGNNPFTREMWRLLDTLGVDVLIAAHDHLYERFAPQTADGVATPAGVRQFIVGTGGATLYSFQRAVANSQVRIRSHGVLRFEALLGSYTWSFVDLNGAVADTGSEACQ
jgi:hypothetical protein